MTEDLMHVYHIITVKNTRAVSYSVVLNLPPDNKGKRSENKLGANISLYIVLILVIFLFSDTFSF